MGGALLAARSPASPAPREECTIEQELQAWQGLPCACLSVGRIRAFADWVIGVRRSRGSFFIYLFGCVDFFDYHYFYFYFFFSRASSPEFYCGPDLSAGAEKPRGAVPSRAEPPAPGPARGSASLAQSRPRVGRGAAEWRAPRRRLPAEQPGAAAAPRPGRGGSRAGGGGSEKAREDPPAPRGEEKEERREGAWM